MTAEVEAKLISPGCPSPAPRTRISWDVRLRMVRTSERAQITAGFVRGNKCLLQIAR